MITSRDVYMAANLLIKQYGREVSIFAGMSADRLALQGDRDGEALWLRVIRAIHELERRVPAASEKAQ